MIPPLEPPFTANGYEVRIWAEGPEADDQQYAYWNDEEVESSKAWNVVKGFAEQERHLESSGLLAQLGAALRHVKSDRGGLGRVGADLACGTAWSTVQLLADPAVERVYCVEYSRHRLLKLAPLCLAHYGVSPSRVVLCAGSFYELQLADGSLDFVLLAEAFHHAGEPDRLLREVRRVLQPDGVVIVVGEHRVPPLPLVYVKHALQWAISRIVPAALQRRVRGKVITRPKALFVTPSTLLAPHPLTGDHYYTLRKYKQIFHSAGFSAEVLAAGTFRGFVLRPLLPA